MAMFVDRPYQTEAVRAIRDHYLKGIKRQLVILPTAAGKTITFSRVLKARRANGPALILAHTDELLEQAMNKLSLVWPGVNVGLVKAEHNNWQGMEVVVSSVQTLSKDKRINQFPADYFKTVIVDECFVAGTMVGDIPIEHIKLGDMVPCFNEHTKEIKYSKVTHLFKNPAPMTLYRITIAGTSIICTAEHPILTQDGWKDAKDIKDGDLVYGNVSRMRRPNEKSIEEMQGMLSKTPIRTQPQGRSRQDESKQSDERSCHKRENVYNSQEDQPQAEDSGWQWQEDLSTTGEVSSRARMDGSGICSTNQDTQGQWISNQLQDRHCQSEFENRHRSGRGVSPSVRKTAAGYEERQLLEINRVDSVEILEQGSSDEYTKVCPDGYVYNIEVEKYNTYFANGIAVHNCHHAVSPSYMKIINHFAPKGSNVLLTGWTATANRGDKANLRKVFDKVVYYRSVDQMVKEGWLVPPISQYVNIQTDFGKFRSSGGDFNQDDLADALNTEINNKDIVRAWWVYAFKQGRKSTICFTVDVKHAYAICHWFRQCPGITSEVIHGEMPKADRKAIIADFKAGKIQVLVNCMVLTEGFDHAAIDCVLMARPTASQALYMQCCGRGLRPILGSDGKADLTIKPNCLILDVVGNSVNHKLVTMPAVYGGAEYKPNTKKAKDVAKQSKPRKIRLKTFGDTRQVQSTPFTMFPWLELTAEDFILSFPFKNPFFLRIVFDFDTNTWQYQHFYDNPSMPYYSLIASYDTAEQALAKAEADAVVLSKDPSKLTTDAYWRKKICSKKQKDMLIKLGIELEGVDQLTIGEVSDIITSFVVNRSIAKMNANKQAS